MTNLQINALLYDGARVEIDGVVINSWFDDSTVEKNIELVWSNPLREVGFIANGMTPSELRRRLENEIRSWVMVMNEKSEG
ncbi:MAG: hypothetical protein PUC01_05250 [Spirochaetales bacterium]|nr:hypothetical protein [Spirochaetales bacterium]